MNRSVTKKILYGPVHISGGFRGGVRGVRPPPPPPPPPLKFAKHMLYNVN